MPLTSEPGPTCGQMILAAIFVVIGFGASWWALFQFVGLPMMERSSLNPRQGRYATLLAVMAFYASYRICRPRRPTP